MGRAPGLRQRLSTLFDDEAPPRGASSVFNTLLAVLIVLNVAAVILDSVTSIRDHFGYLFQLVDEVATTVFVVEFLLRLWTCVDFHSGRYRRPLLGRLRYLRSLFAIIDLVAILPAILGVLGAGDLRVLRLLRLLRMLKLTRHSHIFSLLWAVFVEEARSIGAVLFILVLTLTLSGAMVYMVEGDVQPAIFSSIPASMWWAIETLTTVGYGDMVPQTAFGKMLGGIVSVIGIGTLALFSGLITVSFMNQLRLRRSTRKDRLDADSHALEQHETLTKCPSCGRIVGTAIE
jgi:voltage-gated potassium channel